MALNTIPTSCSTCNHSERFFTDDALPHAPQNMHLFDPTTVTSNKERPLTHMPDPQSRIPTIPTNSLTSQPRSQIFPYQMTTNRLPQVPIVLPILNAPPTIWPIFLNLFLISIMSSTAATDSPATHKTSLKMLFKSRRKQQRQD